MKITLDALDGRGFTLRIPHGEGAEHVVALHEAKRLRGAYEHDAARFSLDPVEADAVVGEVTWALADGSIHIAGPATLGATTLDIDIARGDRTPSTTGKARCASIDAPDVRLTRKGLELRGALEVVLLHCLHDVVADAWTMTADALGVGTLSLAMASLDVRLERLEARPVEMLLGGGAMRLAAREASARGVALTIGDTTLKAASVTITGLRVARDAAGATTVEAEGIELADVEVEVGSRRARSPSMRLGALRHAAEGTSIEQVIVDELSLAIEGLAADSDDERSTTEAAPAEEAPAAVPVGTRLTLGVDLPFLDHLDAKVEADIVVDVKLPVLKRRVATHRVRLAIEGGALDFKELEHGLSRLEDAILDFEVVDEGLMLELDAVLVKRELLLWPLDAEGMSLARQNRVRLRTLTRPTMIVREPSPDDGGDPRVALHRVEVRGVQVEGGLRGASSMPLRGGTLRLGGDGVAALGLLLLRGTLIHDVTPPPVGTEVTVELTDLDAGVDAVDVGGRRLDVGRMHLGRIPDGRVTLRGFKPTAVTATLRGLQVQGFRLGARAP